MPFESSDQYFSFTTYTNTDADYEHRTYTVHNSVSKSPILYDLKTRKAGFISGTVYLYSKKSGKKDVIDNAKIRLEQGSSDGETGFPMNPNLPGSPGSKKNPSDPFKLDELYAYSGYSLEHKPGHYKLGNIPVGKHSFMASKSKSGTIGEEKVLNIPKEGLKNVDFFLQVYEDMDITQMLGIPMDVEKLDSTKTGVYITGSLSELPASPHFSAAPATELGFTSIKIVPGSKKGAQGVPYPKPDVLPMQSNVKSFPITYNYSPTGKYNAVLKSLKSCLTVNAAADEKGSVIGSLYIPANQFSPKLSFGSATENGFYLSGYNKVGKMLLFFEVLSSDGKDPFSDSPQGLNICNSKGTDANYTLLSFNAHFESAKSFLRGDSITLATIIDLPPPGGGKATIPLTIGNVRLRGSDVAISSLANSTLPEIALDKWVLQGKKISFMGDNLVMDGSVKTGTLDIPFTGMPITPQGWKPENAVFTLSQLSIAGIIPLALSGSVKFGHDISSMPPCWKLQSSGKGDKVVASFGGIKGMPVQDSIYVTSFSLTSFGSNSFLLKPDVPIHFYGLVTFVPNVLTVSSSGVDIKGNDQLFVAGGFNYSDRTLSLFSQAGLISFDSKKLLFDISKYYAKGTQLDFPLSGQELNENGFFATGVLVDAVYPKSYNFPVKLSCIPDSTAVTVLPQNSAGIATTFPIGKDGSKYLNNIVGDLRYDYDAKAWSNLSFSGSLQGANGATSTMSFKVSGAIQTDGDQKIAVTNIPSPFGEATMTFNFSTGAMHGAINVKADLPGAGHLDGQADLQIDQSGWYFAAAGDLQLYNPNIGIQAALILGSYPNIQSITEVTEKFDKLPWKPEVPQAMRSIPQEYNNLGGFYFCGEALNFLGITLPSIDVDLDPIVHCSVNFYYGAALSLGMNFSQGKQFNMGAAVFIGVDADAGGSIGIACGGGTLHGGLSLFGMGSFNTSNGNWSVTGACDVLLKGSLYAGWGICSSSCGWKTCDKHEWGPASMTFGLINFHASSNGVSISP